MIPITYYPDQLTSHADSLSTLWFCLALNPISRALCNTAYGFQVRYGNRGYKSDLYMDDLKPYTSSTKYMKNILKSVYRTSCVIVMTFDVKPRLKHEPYKYLGVTQTNKIENTLIKYN